MKSRLTVVLIALLASTLLPVSRAEAQQKTIVVTGYGGRWSDVMKKALVEPFEKKHGEKVDGPYYAQDADLLYLMWTKSGNIGESGREFLPWVTQSKIPLEPVNWQVALTEKEFWG